MGSVNNNRSVSGFYLVDWSVCRKTSMSKFSSFKNLLFSILNL